MLINRIKSILQRVLISDLDYFDEQFMYGHRESLLHELVKDGYLADGHFMLEAGLQHGWLSEAGIWRVRNRRLVKSPRYVWNSRWQTHLAKETFNIAIGAPWLYFLRSIGFNKENSYQNRTTSKKFLVFPGHSGLSLPKNQIRQAKYFSEIADPLDSTVCLFWLDFCNPAIREAFEDRGYVVKCVGFGSARQGDARFSGGGRVNYFVNLLDLFLTHEIIVTDEISSGQLYALTLGVKLMYVPNEESFNFMNRALKTVVSTNPFFQKSHHEWVEKFAPDFLSTKNNPKSFCELAWKELGEDSLLSNEQLLELIWIKMDPKYDLNQYLVEYKESLNSINIEEYFK